MKRTLFALVILIGSFSMVNAQSKYVAKLTESGGEPPTAYVLENTLGGELVWSRISEGRYRCTLADAFNNELKITGLREFHFTDQGGKWRLYWDDETENSGDSLILESYNAEGQLSDGVLVYTEVRFEIYEE